MKMAEFLRGTLLPLISDGNSIRQVLLVAGLYFSLRKGFSFIRSGYEAFKTFGLPLVWPRNFSKEYGQWAVVTGCTRGMGLCFVQELAKKGMDIVLIGRSIHKLTKIAADIRSTYGVSVEVIEANFSDGQSVFKNIEQGLDGKDIGVLVNNVGVIPEHPMYFTEHKEDILWDLVIVNVGAATQMCRIVLPKMLEKRKGAIINMASSAALKPQPLQSVYTATKAYMDFFSDAIAYEYKNKGITIQTVDPYYVCTGMVDFSDDLNKPSLLVPEPEVFVKSVLRSLGFAQRTTGYWSHSLERAVLSNEFLPYMMLVKQTNEKFRREALAKHKKKG